MPGINYDPTGFSIGNTPFSEQLGSSNLGNATSQTNPSTPSVASQFGIGNPNSANSQFAASLSGQNPGPSTSAPATGNQPPPFIPRTNFGTPDSGSAGMSPQEHAAWVQQLHRNNLLGISNASLGNASGGNPTLNQLVGVGMFGNQVSNPQSMFSNAAQGAQNYMSGVVGGGEGLFQNQGIQNQLGNLQGAWVNLLSQLPQGTLLANSNNNSPANGWAASFGGKPGALINPNNVSLQGLFNMPQGQSQNPGQQNGSVNTPNQQPIIDPVGPMSNSNINPIQQMFTNLMMQQMNPFMRLMNRGPMNMPANEEMRTFVNRPSRVGYEMSFGLPAGGMTTNMNSGPMMSGGPQSGMNMTQEQRLSQPPPLPSQQDSHNSYLLSYLQGGLGGRPQIMQTPLSQPTPYEGQTPMYGVGNQSAMMQNPLMQRLLMYGF